MLGRAVAMGYYLRGRLGVRAPAVALMLAGGLVLLAPAAGAHATLSWSGPVGRDAGGQGSAIAAVACPAASTCVAVTQGGTALTFDSDAPQRSTPVSIDTVPPTGLACLSTSECVAVDGSGNAITFNPANPSAAVTTPIDSGQSLTAVTCVPGGGQCVAVDSSGNAVAFNPAAPGTHATDPIDTGLRLIGVSCPDQTHCVAIDSADEERTFNPQTTTGPSSIQTVDATTNELTALTCPSSTQCLAFDNIGQQMSTNPQAVSTPTTSDVDPAGNAIVAATCPSSTQCVAVDNAGDVVSFAPGQAGIPTAIDAAKDLAGIACPSQCVSGDATGHIHSFAPTGAGATSTLIDAQAAYSAVACPETSQCTAMDNFGDEATFDPGSAAPAPATAIDPNADVVYGIACPAVIQCTAVDDLGQAATFNPLSPSGATVTAIVTGHPLLAVACPTTTQCTAVDDDRYAVTFNPQSPTAAVYTDLDTAVGTSLVDIACPSPGQCTALDGAGDAVTFDPQAAGTPSPTRVLPGPGVGIACPATTECIAVDGDGDRATFDPRSPAGATTASVSSDQPAALSCPSPTYCVGLDAAGAAFEFDPHGTGATDIRTIGDGAQVADLTCPAITRCVSVDYAGTAFTAVQTLPGLPTAVTVPGVTGHLVQGDLLTAHQGSWRNAPTSYSPRWERCMSSGRSCRAITGATALTYRAVKADVGHALRVVETPANPLGDGPPTTSRATRAIAGLPAGPAVSGARLTDPVRGHPQLTLALAAARFGPQLRTITVRLPAGLSVTARGPAAAAALTVGGRRARGTVRRVRGGFVIALGRAARSLRLRLAGPRLVVSRGLASRVRRHRVRRLSMTIALGTARALRTAARMAVTR